jgi:S1-C subfamily serine protease
MNIQIGPQAKQKFRELQLNRLRTLRALFWIVLLSGPILLIILQKASWIKPMSSTQTGEGVVAMVEADGSYGSAFNVGTRLWVTALHVVENIEEGSEVTMQYEKSKKPLGLSTTVKYHSTDENLDFSILESDESSNDGQVHFGLGDFNNVSLGDEVIIIGYPMGEYTYAKSQVINLDLGDNSELFMMAGNAWPGNSGGPIVHIKTGEVIGVLVAGFENEYKGMVVGLKINEVKRKIDSFKK